MSAPNPFMYGGGAAPAPADNPFGDPSGAVSNPYMAQQQMGFGGYNQFGQMQTDPNNPYASYGGGMGMQQQPGMMGYGGYDQQQYGQQQFGGQQYNQFGQPMAQMN